MLGIGTIPLCAIHVWDYCKYAACASTEKNRIEKLTFRVQVIEYIPYFIFFT